MHLSTDRLIQVVKSRWFVIAVGIWAQCTGGAPYAFSVYSQTIKINLQYDQQDLSYVSFSKDIGANVGIIAGLMCDMFPTWIILAIAALEGFLGYFMIWLSVSAKISRPAVWQMCVYMCVAANAQTFLNTAVVVTCVKIFPTSRGLVVGLMKGYLGLSSALLVQFYHAIYANDQASFVLMISWLLPSVCVAAMFIIRPIPAVKDKNEQRWFNMLSVITLTLALYLLVVSLLQIYVSLGRTWGVCIFMVAIFILLIPLWVVVKAEPHMEESKGDSCETNSLLIKIPNTGGISCSEILPDYMAGGENNIEKLGESSQEISIMETPSGLQQNAFMQEKTSCNPSSQVPEDSMSHGQKNKSEIASEKSFSIHPTKGENFTLFQAVRDADFWILFLVTGCCMGSGLTTINSMSQLGSSLGYSQREVSVFVSLWSIWNFLGRFSAGYISDLYLHSKSIGRPFFISISLATMGIGHLIIASSFSGSLYLGPILVGICYGAQWSLMPATTSELFGLQNFGTLFNTITIADPLGSYILSVKVAGYLYDLEAKKEKSLHITDGKILWVTSNLFEELSCNGPHCFRLTFLIMATVCFFGFAISIWLFLRTRNFYKLQDY